MNMTENNLLVSLPPEWYAAVSTGVDMREVFRVDSKETEFVVRCQAGAIIILYKIFPLGLDLYQLHALLDSECFYLMEDGAFRSYVRECIVSKVN